MSRMSQLAMELDEQAWELGFKGVEDAEQHGWRVNYKKQKLEPPVVQSELDVMREQELAHQEWLAKRQNVLADLWAMYRFHKAHEETTEATVIKQAIDFIDEGER